MLEKNLYRIILPCHKSVLVLIVLVCLVLYCSEVHTCSPGRSGSRRRSTRKLTPLVFKQHVPNVPEHSFGGSGPPEGRIWRDDVRFKNLVPNYNSDIVFKDEEGTGVDRLMTPRCKERLDILAISVMNMWPGVRLRVTEGFDEEGHHSEGSLHYEGRAVAISTSDRETSKYGMLARLAVDAGFDWVFYESRSHIYCSVKTESIAPSRFSGCFHATSTIVTRRGTKALANVKEGDEVLSTSDYETLSYSKVIGFLHRDSTLKVKFLHLATSSAHRLLVTENHLIFKGLEAIHAKDVTTGDVITTTSHNGTFVESMVTSVETVHLSGVYAPLTESGTIVVEGVLCSCYAVLNSHNMAHAAFLPLRILYRIRDNVYSVVYYVCNFTSGWLCLKDAHMKSHAVRDFYIHWYASFLCDFSDMFARICD